MLAYFVLLLAVASRFAPHIFHASAWNFTAVGGGLLFFGSKMGSTRTSATVAKLVSAVAVLMATDVYLTVAVYQYPFHLRGYIVTWLWYAAVCLVGLGILEKPSVLGVAAGTLASATSFFLLSNFMVWAGGGLYQRTLAGLSACYVAGIPFYRNDLVSTALTAGALFGLPVLAAKVAETINTVHNSDLPLR